MVEIMNNAAEKHGRAEGQKNSAVFPYDAGKGELHG